MKKDKMFKILDLIVPSIIIILSIIFYSKLPDKIAVQVNSSGEPSNIVSKGIFTIMMNGFIVFFNIYSIFINKENKKSKHLLVNLIVLAAFIFVLFYNIK